MYMVRTEKPQMAIMYFHFDLQMRKPQEPISWCDDVWVDERMRTLSVGSPSRTGSKRRADRCRGTRAQKTYRRQPPPLSYGEAIGTDLADDVEHVDPLDVEALVLETRRQDHKEDVKVCDREPGEDEVDKVVDGLDHEDDLAGDRVLAPPDPAGVPERVAGRKQGAVQPSTTLQDEPTSKSSSLVSKNDFEGEYDG
jgi:hypothetical protein